MMRKYRHLKKRLRIKKRKPFYKKKGFWISILLLVFFGGVFYLIFFSKVFQIKEIRISGNERISTEDLRELINSKIEKKFFLPTKSIFLVKLKSIEREVLNKFSLIDEAKLKRKLPNILILEAKERRSLVIFCSLSEKCFKVDKLGIAFEESLEKKDLAIFSQKEEEVFLGKQVIEPGYLNSILEIQKQLKDDLKIEIEKFLVSDEKLTVKTLEGFEIYFNPDNDIKDQVFNLDNILKEKITAERRNSLEYIDLRFGNKVFYK